MITIIPLIAQLACKNIIPVMETFHFRLRMGSLAVT